MAGIEDLFGSEEAGPSVDMATSVKPSKDIHDRGAINGRLRHPNYNGDSSSEAPLILGNGLQYGRHITYIDANRAKEHKTPDYQMEKFEKLRHLLRKSDGNRDVVYLRELYKDLEKYPTRLLPKRSAHDGLMAAIKTSIEYGIPVNISIVKPHMLEGKLAVGYEVNPIS